MKLAFVALCASAAVVTGAGCGLGSIDGSGPVIFEVDPASASRGAEVDIIGDRFCGDDAEAADEEGRCAQPPAGLVTFDGERATVVTWRHELITVTVPDGAEPGDVSVVVTANGLESNSADFEVLD